MSVSPPLVPPPRSPRRSGSADAGRARRAAEAWVQRIRALEHEHVAALERHLEIQRRLAA